MNNYVQNRLYLVRGKYYKQCIQWIVVNCLIFNRHHWPPKVNHSLLNCVIYLNFNYTFRPVFNINTNSRCYSHSERRSKIYSWIILAWKKNRRWFYWNYLILYIIKIRKREQRTNSMRVIKVLTTWKWQWKGICLQ